MGHVPPLWAVSPNAFKGRYPLEDSPLRAGPIKRLKYTQNRHHDTRQHTERRKAHKHKHQHMNAKSCTVARTDQQGHKHADAEALAL